MQNFSGFLFYSFGLVFFAAYLCYYNELLGKWPIWIFEVFDLPFALIAFVYGGTSLHASLVNHSKKGRASAIVITLLLTLLFGWLIVLNYWNILALPSSGN